MLPPTFQPDPNAVKYTPFFGIRGRNGNDPVFMVPDTQCLEALNIDWYQSSLGRKRGGSAAIGITGGTAFTTGAYAMGVFVPSADPTLSELWAVDNAGSPLTKRLAGGTTWANVTYDDAISFRPQDWHSVSFNNKLYAAYDSAVNRLHCYDPRDSSPHMRRVGIKAATAAPTHSQAGGSVTDGRKYRTAFTKQVAGVTTLRSNLSPTSTITTLAAEDATVTRQTAPGEGETHWELWAYSATDTYGAAYLIATTVIATTTAVDNNASLVTFSTDVPEEGANTPPPSARFLVSDDARLIMAGAYEAAAGDSLFPDNNTIWWTQSLGASNVGDDERISNTDTIKGYDRVEEAVTGLSTPVQGTFLAFSLRSRWKFVATGIARAPYRRFRVTGGRGCISHKSIATAIDADGNPATYWVAADGPCRAGQNGEESLVYDIQDIWDRVNLDATVVTAHTLYVPQKHQVWFYLAIDGANAPNVRVVFDTLLGRVTGVTGVRHGWSLHTGECGKAYCSVMFSTTIAASMGRRQSPYIGYTEGLAIWRQDTADTDDAGVAFQAYVESKPLSPWGLGRLGGIVEEPTLIAKTGAGVSIQLTISRDEGAEVINSSVLLTAISDVGAETRVFPQYEGAKVAQASSIRLRIGDAAAVSNAWNLDALVLPLAGQGSR